jgi:hypothetical protein
MNDNLIVHDSVSILPTGFSWRNVVVYLAQQITQFRVLGKEFAMQHLGAEDELKQVLRDIWATMSPEERLEVFSPEERLRLLRKELAMQHLGADDELKQVLREIVASMTPEERLEYLVTPDLLERLAPAFLARIPLEERLRGLTPEELDRLRRLLPPEPPSAGDAEGPK